MGVICTYKMNIIPIDKCDFDSIKKLQACSDKEVLPYTEELLTWIQDVNWPVAAPICMRLSMLGEKITEPIVSILNSNDSIWKYNVITQIITKFREPIPDKIIELLIRIINSPSEDEKQEEVDLVAKDIMVRYSHGI